jgi:hypothetical protein
MKLYARTTCIPCNWEYLLPCAYVVPQDYMICVQAVNAVVIKAIDRELEISWVSGWKVWNWSSLVQQHSFSLTLPRVWFGTYSLSFLERDLWVAAQRNRSSTPPKVLEVESKDWGRLPEWSLFWTPRSDTMWVIYELTRSKKSEIS